MSAINIRGQLDAVNMSLWMKAAKTSHGSSKVQLLIRHWLSQVNKFINFRTTSDLESFQNHILMCGSKRFAYSPPVYRTRVLLAALDYNNHNHRQPARNKDGHKIRYFNKKIKKLECLHHKGEEAVQLYTRPPEVHSWEKNCKRERPSPQTDAQVR